MDHQVVLLAAWDGIRPPLNRQRASHVQVAHLPLKMQAPRVKLVHLVHFLHLQPLNAFHVVPVSLLQLLHLLAQHVLQVLSPTAAMLVVCHALLVHIPTHNPATVVLAQLDTSLKRHLHRA